MTGNGAPPIPFRLDGNPGRDPVSRQQALYRQQNNNYDNGKRIKTTYEKIRELQPVVQRPGNKGRPGRAVARERLHDNKAIRLCHLGEDAAPARRHVQGDRRPERILPPAHPQVVPLALGRTRGGIRQGVCRRDPLQAEGQGRQERR